jgi:hypothetical protein
MEFSVDLEELRVIKSDVAIIKNHAFRHVRGLKALDLSENKITHIENEAFTEVMFCCKASGVDDGRIRSIEKNPPHQDSNPRPSGL